MITNRSDLLTLWIVIMFVVVCYSKKFNLESYTTIGNYKRYCPKCNNKNKMDCAKCTNCGYCTTVDGQGSCEHGDYYGPYNKMDCIKWRYYDPYELGQRSRKYNKRYPPNVDIYPHLRWNSLREDRWRFRNRVNNPAYLDELRCTSQLNSNIRDKLLTHSA